LVTVLIIGGASRVRCRPDGTGAAGTAGS